MSRRYDTSSTRSSWKLICGAGFVAIALVIGISGCKKESGETAALGQVCIDLSKYANASLTDSLNSPAQVKENNFASLPKGRQVLAGVPFQVDGILELSGKKNIEWGRTEYPE